MGHVQGLVSTKKIHLPHPQRKQPPPLNVLQICPSGHLAAARGLGTGSEGGVLALLSAAEPKLALSAAIRILAACGKQGTQCTVGKAAASACLWLVTRRETQASLTYPCRHRNPRLCSSLSARLCCFCEDTCLNFVKPCVEVSLRKDSSPNTCQGPWPEGSLGGQRGASGRDTRTGHSFTTLLEEQSWPFHPTRWAWVPKGGLGPAQNTPEK